jgi:S1-C subfamily serine protease
MCSSLDVIEQIMAGNSSKTKLTFTKTKDATPSSRSFKVSLGVMPDYAFSGAGMKLDGVTEGKPAIKAGLQRGDVITKVGSYEVGSVQDYMQALSKLNKGEKVEITFVRNGETKTTTAEL